MTHNWAHILGLSFVWSKSSFTIYIFINLCFFNEESLHTFQLVANTILIVIQRLQPMTLNVKYFSPAAIPLTLITMVQYGTALPKGSWWEMTRSVTKCYAGSAFHQAFSEHNYENTLKCVIVSLAGCSLSWRSPRRHAAPPGGVTELSINCSLLYGTCKGAWGVMSDSMSYTVWEVKECISTYYIYI